MWGSKLKVEKVKESKNIYVLKQPLIYKAFIVPTNFYTDFASVPKFLHWLIKPQGRHSRASVLHDFLYTLRKFSRFKADVIFYQAMKDDNVKFKYRATMFLGVFLFGAFFKRGRKI